MFFTKKNIHFLFVHLVCYGIFILHIAMHLKTFRKCSLQLHLPFIVECNVILQVKTNVCLHNFWSPVNRRIFQLNLEVKSLIKTRIVINGFKSRLSLFDFSFKTIISTTLTRPHINDFRQLIKSTSISISSIKYSNSLCQILYQSLYK